MPPLILIASGGIGGLTAGIALRRAGFEVRVLERASRIAEIGAGLTVQSNALLALRRIGLDQEVLGNGQVLEAASVRRPDGKIISRVDLAEVGRVVGAPAVAIHRATLQRLLLDALGEDAVETGREVEGYEARPDSVSALFRGGRRAEGALLIGADGIRSAIRDQLLGDGEPLCSGYTCWRGVTHEGGPRRSRTRSSWPTVWPPRARTPTAGCGITSFAASRGPTASSSPPSASAGWRRSRTPPAAGSGTACWP